MKLHRPRLPKFGDWILKLAARYEVNSHLRGDFDEEFSFRCQTGGYLRAWLWYWTQLLRSLPVFIKDSLSWGFVMLGNYLKIALRNFKKHKVFSFINIAGLSLGLTFAVLILIFIRYEFSYDRFHKNAESIYRIIQKNEDAWAGSAWWNATPGPLKSVLLDECPGVKNAARLCLWRSIIDLRGLFSAGNVNHFDTNVYLVDPEFLEIFTFPLAAGDQKTALKEPFSILLTEEMAEILFGEENPVGKILNVDNAYDYKITGVLKNIPENSHVHFNFLISFSTIYSFPEGKEGNIDHWESNNYITYLQLSEDIGAEDVQLRLPGIFKKYAGEKYKVTHYLDPLTRIHLHSNINLDLETNGDIRMIYLMSTIAFCILLIACFNYMNLSTARSSLRFKEVGVRKVIGADRRNLFRQFLGESFLFSILALLLSFLLVKALLPVFGRFVNRELDFAVLSVNGTLLALIVGITLMVGLTAGIYPAIYLSSFRPAQVFRGTFLTRPKNAFHVRNILVIFQFTVSIILIVCTFFIHNQLNYIKNKDLGFRKEHIVTVRIQDQHIRQNYEPLLEAFKQQPEILDATASDDLPYGIRGGGRGVDWENRGPDDPRPSFYNAFVDHNFLDFYGIKLTAGRNFSKSHPTDEKAYILNQTGINAIGLKDPIGKMFRHWKGEGTIIGVVEDFHFFPLNLNIEPMEFSLIYKGEKEYLNKYAVVNYYSLKISSENIPEALAVIEKTYKQFTEYPFSYSFLDERIDNMYRTEQRMGQSFIIFSHMAVFIACLGLFGLASFTAERKTKEIGIRRILGASIPALVIMLVRLFFKWLLIAGLIACPIAYYAMSRWVQNFTYRADPEIWIFLVPPLLTGVIAFMTVVFQSCKAAAVNPVDSLRYE